MKTYQVFLSPLAETKLTILLDYLTEEWGIGSRDKYLSKLKKQLVKFRDIPEVVRNQRK